MSDTFRCDDKETLVAYLYGEIDPEMRRQVDGHLRTCTACTLEIDGLQHVRGDLESWLPPEPELGFTIVQKPSAVAVPQAAAASAWSSVPTWARYAAAVLVMGVGVAIANVQVRYAPEGLTITTGWLAPVDRIAAVPAPVAPVLVQPVTASVSARDDEWRQALAALETEMRREIQSVRQASVPQSGFGARLARATQLNENDPAFKDVRALVAESEKRQQRELALRLLQFNREVETRRLTDLARIDSNFGHLYGATGVNNEKVNVLMRRASNQPQQ